jgi:hypothetical protein
MATITMEFSITEMLSIQIGDIAYYSTPSQLGGFQESTNILTEIGVITNVSQSQSTLSITCDIDNNTTPPTQTDFIIFAKDNRVNVASLAGYYGVAKFVNDSNVKAEMFATSCEIDESSK